MRTRALRTQHIGAWTLSLGMLLVLCMTVGLHAAPKQALTRGAPQAGGMPNPSAFKNEREAAEYLTALEHQNKVLTNRLGELENSANQLSSILQDKETRLVQLSQALGEKEQLVATILANEDALSEALAMRDERVALLEETLHNLKARANRAVEIEDKHQQLAHAYNDLQAKLEPTQQELTTEREARQKLAAAYNELCSQREQLDTALKDANVALIDMDSQLEHLSKKQGSHQELTVAHQELSKQYAKEKQARSQIEAKLTSLSHEREATTQELHQAQLALTQLQERAQLAEEDLALMVRQQATEQTQWEIQERAHAELSESYQHLAASSYALQADLHALAEHNEQVEKQLAAESERMAALTNQYEELRSRYTDQKTSLERADARIEALTMTHSQEQKQWELQEKAHHELVEAYHVLSNQCYDQETELAKATTKIEMLSSKEQKTQENHQELLEAFAALTENHDHLKQQLLATNTRCQELSQELIATQATYAKSESERDQETATHHKLSEAHQMLANRFYDQENALNNTKLQLEELTAIRQIEHSHQERQEQAHAELVQAYVEIAQAHKDATNSLAMLQEERLELKEKLAMAERTRTLETTQQDMQEQAHAKLVDAYREVSAQCCEQECTLVELQRALDLTNSELTAVRDELRDRTEHLHTHMNEHAALAQQCQGLALTNHSLETQLEELAQLSRERDSSVLAARSEATQLKNQLEELSHSWQALDGEKQALSMQLAHLEGNEKLLSEVKADLKQRDDTIALLTATSHDQQTALNSLERTRDSLARELSDLKAFQGALLQWEVEKLATARTAATPEGRSAAERAYNAATRIHIVSPGETLSTIAQEYNKSIQDLYNANSDSIPNQNQVRIGTALVIP